MRFGPYEADLATGELKKDGARVSLQDKPFQILALLLARPGELVTREELRAQLWPADTFVDFEHGLNTAVKKLRQALDDSAEEPRYVETLPRRGYRFIAPVSGGDAVEVKAAAAIERPPARTWHPHATGALLVLAAAALVLNRGDVSRATPPPNARPVVVLMDSPLAGRVYDPRTLAAGGTNADDITDALQGLPVAIQKENTSAMWHREVQVVRQNPDLIVCHLSCLLDERFSEPAREGPVFDHLFDLASGRLAGVFGYVAAQNTRTRFLVYSRGAFLAGHRGVTFVADAEARFPALRGRVFTMDIPGPPEKQTFRDPDLARLIRDRVRQILDLR